MYFLCKAHAAGRRGSNPRRFIAILHRVHGRVLRLRSIVSDEFGQGPVLRGTSYAPRRAPGDNYPVRPDIEQAKGGSIRVKQRSAVAPVRVATCSFDTLPAHPPLREMLFESSFRIGPMLLVQRPR